MTQMMSRRAVCAGLLAAPLIRPGRAAASAPAPLTARAASVQLAPPGYGMTEVWSYDGSLPGPVLRAAQGGRLSRRLVNELEVPTSVHWHGIRIDNAMDGVAGLTQEAVPPGGSFDYDFALPDAGTYWYHAHTNSMEQVARGLSGALIVEEATPPDVDADEILMLDDWLIDPDTAQFYADFTAPMMRSHAGRMGNLIGVNGRFDHRLKAGQNARLRLRLINAANARIFVLRLQGMEGWTVALDGMPLASPEPLVEEIILAPAQRVDLIVDVTAEESTPAGLLYAADDDSWQALVELEVSGRASDARRAAPQPLPPNPRMEIGGLEEATPREMRMEGGAMRGMASGRFEGRQMDFQELIQRGQFWALAGQVGRGADPFARYRLGETARITFVNDTVFPHAMHLHGMHFRQLNEGAAGPMRDTLLVMPQQSAEIAFVADNPGKWLLHCHMLGHAASGMSNWIEVV
ncbi:multicopper oxidase family protein [Alloyangia pacifica]|uniref:multicopper oxidase family protein n=1 Tax=Alloyangia pacifica TaxID=311180 RepID=UPI001CD217CB|nr:multicopper oxidase family protein [Alloyangia pacifica]MCA0996097.1 multicopper oxidase family protein [Alloyangia pacifica]